MVLPIGEALTTPCLTSRMNPAARNKLKKQYRTAKRYGIRSAWGVITGAGVIEVAKVARDIAKGEIARHGKERLGLLVLLCCTHVGLVMVPMITNSTKVIRFVTKAHGLTSCVFRCAHDTSEVTFVALDFLIFGEYVPSCPDNGYKLLNVSSDALANFDD